jgi:Domain of unknown function (DUF4145)
LRAALNYISSDPESSLTKCRVILEKLLKRLYVDEMHKEPSRPMIGDMLSNKEFSAKIPRRILERMKRIRGIANLGPHDPGPHGGDVDSRDAIGVMSVVLDVLEWYVINYDLSGSQKEHVGGKTPNAQTLEILPQLRAKYSDYLRSDLKSVRFGHIAGRCYLEITKEEVIAGYLHNETIKREDLGFITNGADLNDLYFNPNRSVVENAHRFVSEFDEISIINCTDLFTEEAATMIYNYWSQHRKTPSSK